LHSNRLNIAKKLPLKNIFQNKKQKKRKQINGKDIPKPKGNGISPEG